MPLMWHDINKKEMQECGIPEQAQSIAVQLLNAGGEEVVKRYQQIGRTNVPSEVFFGEAKDAAHAILLREIQESMGTGDATYVSYYFQIIHALAHYARYSVAHAEYQRSKDAFERELSELIGA